MSKKVKGGATAPALKPQPSPGRYMADWMRYAGAVMLVGMSEQAVSAKLATVSVWEKMGGVMAWLASPLNASWQKGKKAGKAPASVEEHLRYCGITDAQWEEIKRRTEAKKVWQKSRDAISLATTHDIGPMPDTFPDHLDAMIKADAEEAGKAQLAQVTAEPVPSAIPQSTALVPIAQTGGAILAAVAAFDGKAAAAESAPSEPTPEATADNGELPAPTPEATPVAEVVATSEGPADTPDMVTQIAEAIDAGDASADPLGGDTQPATSETETTPSETASEPISEEPAPTADAGQGDAPVGVPGDAPALGDTPATPLADSACTNCEPEPLPAVIPGVVALVPEVATASPLDAIPAPEAQGDTSQATDGPSHQGDGDGTAPSGDAPAAASADQGDATGDGCAAPEGEETAPGNAVAASDHAGEPSSQTGSASEASDATGAGDTPAPNGDVVSQSGENAGAGSQDEAVTPDPTQSADAGGDSADAPHAGQAGSETPDVSTATEAPASAGEGEPGNEECGDTPDTGAEPKVDAGAIPGVMSIVANGEPIPLEAAPDAPSVGDGASQSAETAASGSETHPDVCDGKMFSEKTPEQQAAARERLNRRLGLDGDHGASTPGNSVPTGSDASASGAIAGGALAAVADSLGEMKAKVERNISIARAAFEGNRCETTARHFRTVAKQMLRECGAVFGHPDMHAIRAETRDFVEQTNNKGRKSKLGLLASAQALKPGYAAAAVSEATLSPEQESTEATAAAGRAALLGTNASDAGIPHVPEDTQ